MRNLSPFIILFLIVILTTAGIAQEKKRERGERDLFYTYIGPIISVGHAHIWYNDWIGSSHKKQLLNGFFISGGALLAVFVKNLTGSISIQYIYSFNSNYPIQHLLYKMSGKYLFHINDLFSIGVGAGAYFESPPSDHGYLGGAGALLPVEFIINTTSETRLIIDAFAQFGYFGKGQDSLKLGYGIDVAFVFKVGRI